MPQTAQQKIGELFNSTVGDNRIVYDFNLFDRSVSQKLWSADYYCKQLASIDINNFLVFPSASSTQSYDSITIQTPMLDISAYCCYLNLFLDGFFMNSMSILDTLAHEIYTLYVPQTVPPKIYISTAKNMLVNLHSTCKTGKLLNEQLSQRWFTEFEPFRHCTTHESLIGYDDIGFRFDQVTRIYKLTKKIKLPDNPQVRPFTYDRNRVASEYCQSMFRKIDQLVTRVYECVIQDIRRNGNILPIP